MKFIRIIMLAGLIIIFTNNAKSQRKDFDPSNMPMISTLKGIVVTSLNEKPLQSASIYIYNAKDSSLLSGAISKNDGSFFIENLPYGRFYLVVKYIGYENKTIDSIMLTPRKQEINLGKIKIDLQTVNLPNVEVVADKNFVEYKVEKKIINVSQDIVSTGGTAVDILANVPSVNVDIEGNVTLRGSSNFSVFINGKPSILDPADALAQIPAATIEQIEIITNPSVKYDPDGVAGILNIITKKEKQSGTSGISDISVGTHDKYKANFLYNYKNDGLTIFTGLNYNDDNMFGTGLSRQTTDYSNIQTFMSDNSNRHMNRYGLDFKTGFSYDFSDAATLSLEGKYGQMDFSRDYTSHQISWIGTSDSTIYQKNSSSISRIRDYYAIYLDFMQKFDKPGHILTAGAYYSNRNGSGGDYQEQLLTNADWQLAGSLPFKLKTDEGGVSEDVRIKVDYVNPINEKSSFEAGAQLLMEPENTDYSFQRFDTTSNIWVKDEYFSNVMKFIETIPSLYVTYSNIVYGLNYKIGLRGEYTFRSMDLAKADHIYKINRFDWFPSIHISSKIGENSQIYTSYSRRIDRPHGHELEPFPTYRDQFNYMVGNPDLQPEYINSYELGFLQYIDKSFFSIESYYRNTVNIINRISTPEGNGIFRHTSINLNQDHAIGFELMANLQLVDWFRLNASGNIYKYWLEGKVGNEEIDNNTFAWDGRIGANFNLSQTTILQTNVMYRSNNITAQGTSSGMWGMDVALKQSMFENKLSATLQVRDIFSSFKREYNLTQPDFTSLNKMLHEAPIVTLTLSYKYNNYKQKVKEPENGTGNIDIDF